MPTPPPVPPAERSPYGPDGSPKTFEESHRVSPRAGRYRRMPQAREDATDLVPFVGFALAGLVGYALGATIHGKSARDGSDRSIRPRPHMMPEPVATYRSSLADEDRASDIRYR